MMAHKSQKWKPKIHHSFDRQVGRKLGGSSGLGGERCRLVALPLYLHSFSQSTDKEEIKRAGK